MGKINYTITLVYSAKDEEHNNALILLELLEKPPFTGYNECFKNS